ncbi:lysophospholipid acyltransferase family protein [Seonamhaeicola sp. MEBiC1930]|uniref:lysophospholipid acyltransferase family protein n=1 Tax=Seonamhaeicola sp. MEBiC01930 TaxID=2976768 RepID=UPI003244AC0B
MKKLWLHSVRAYLRLGMFFYFKKVVVYNIENIPRDKPVLLLGNHQNALLDPLLIATKGSRFSFFLTRAAVFKKKFVSYLLGSLQMLPVYRIRDGWNNLTNNNAIFETCSELLKEGEAIVIFPEGSHNLARCVRPLSKGFTRIVFDTLEKYPNIDLQLVPVGLNYIHATQFSDSAAMYFGKAVSAKDFLCDNRNEGVVNLKSKIYTELMKLTTHIPPENYESDLLLLQKLNVDFLNPKEVNTCLVNNFKDCRVRPKTKLDFFNKVFKFLLIINLIMPYAVWKLFAEPKIVELEFKSTFRFAIALTLVPFWLLVITMILVIYFGWVIALMYFFFSLVLALLAIKW